MKYCVYIICICLTAAVVTAEPVRASVCIKKETAVFFGNGINTPKTKAHDSKKTLKQRLKVALFPEEFAMLSFDLAYNDTDGKIRDLFESTIQGLTRDASRFWRILFGQDFMPDFFRDTLLLIATGVDATALVTTDSLQEHVALYKDAISSGKRVLLVAHSQGNFFGNQAYELLDDYKQRNFDMVAVANPDSTVLRDDSFNAPYTTLVNDEVIQAIIAVKLLLPFKPMEPNEMNNFNSDDPLQHKFVETYMVEHSNSLNRVLVDILYSLDTLSTPLDSETGDMITVAISWHGTPDMDLHVFEPNRTHVYYENRYGLSGTLNHDSRDGGTEAYTVDSCENLEVGRYRIGLDYFEGDIPVVVTMQIRAGEVLQDFEFSLLSEMFGNPDYPKMYAEISVDIEEDSTISFAVSEL
jgi:hypothetical protein